MDDKESRRGVNGGRLRCTESSHTQFIFISLTYANVPFVRLLSCFPWHLQGGCIIAGFVPHKHFMDTVIKGEKKNNKSPICACN